MKTGTGKMFPIIEFKTGFSISNYFINGKDFLNSSDTINYMNKSPMKNALISDLNKYGFEELYILTKSAGSDSFIEIMEVASLNDRAFGEIQIQEISKDDIKKDEIFKGYLGNDSVYISDNKMICEFPVFKSSYPDV